MSSMDSVALRLRDAVRGIWREVAKFGVVGALAFVIDNGGYNLLVFGLPWSPGGGPMHAVPVAASVVATGTATLASWAGNRYWTYRRRHREQLGAELGLFVVVNVVGIVITAGTVFLARRIGGVDSVVGDNVARILGWSLATVFRFLAYRRYVFVTALQDAPAPASEEAGPEGPGVRELWRRHRWEAALGALAAFCCAGTVMVFSPGYMSYDTLYQLQQALRQEPLSDWHPPVMSLLWRGLIAVTGTPATMAVLQAVLLWGALWTLAWCVWVTTGRRGASLAVLGVGLFPPVLTFAGVVWKDVHMAFALLGAVAAALAGRRLDAGAVTGRRMLFVAGLVFLVYAVLVRKNAVFAVIPVFVLLVVSLRRRTAYGRLWVTSAAALVLGVLVPSFAVSALARPVQTSQVTQIMLDDLLHVLSAQELRAAHVTPDLRAHLVSAAKECDRTASLSNTYWTCYGRGAHGPFTAVAHPDQIRSVWLRQMPRHAAGYVAYRLQLFTGFLFASRQPFQSGVLDNDLGITVSHPRLEAALRTYVEGAARDLPFLFDAWFWLAAALALSVRPGRGPFRTTVRALGVSSAAYILGYLPILPATDFRYVYWPVLACTLALLLTWAGRPRPATTPPADRQARRATPEYPQPVDRS